MSKEINRLWFIESCELDSPVFLEAVPTAQCLEASAPVSCRDAGVWSHTHARAQKVCWIMLKPEQQRQIKESMTLHFVSRTAVIPVLCYHDWFSVMLILFLSLITACKLSKDKAFFSHDPVLFPLVWVLAISSSNAVPACNLSQRPKHLNKWREPRKRAHNAFITETSNWYFWEDN